MALATNIFLTDDITTDFFFFFYKNGVILKERLLVYTIDDINLSSITSMHRDKYVMSIGKVEKLHLE